VEKLKEVNVVCFLSEVFLEEDIDRCFQHERVIDRNGTDFGLQVQLSLPFRGIQRGTNTADLSL
jgi:hypothetical protein